MELEQAKNKLEDSLRSVDNSMEQVLMQDVDRAAQLKAVIDSQLAYHRKSTELLQQLTQTIQTSITSHNPRQAKTQSAQIKHQQNLNVPFNSNMQFQNFNSNQNQNPNSNSTSHSSSNNNNNNTLTNNNQPQISSPFDSDPWGNANSQNQATTSPNSQPMPAPRNSNSNHSAANFDPWGNNSTTPSTTSVPQANMQSNTQNPNNNNNNSANLYSLPPTTQIDNDPFNLGNLGDPLPNINANNNNFNNSNQNKPSCKALYDFEPEQPGELRFRTDDVIELVSKIDENWYQGRLNGQTGHFPINYVQVITPLP